MHGNEKVLFDVTLPKVVAANTVNLHIYTERREGLCSMYKVP